MSSRARRRAQLRWFPQCPNRRLVIEVSDRVYEELERLEREEGINKTTILNRAAQVYGWAQAGDMVLMRRTRFGFLRRVRIVPPGAAGG